jgi:hypothetical protein
MHSQSPGTALKEQLLLFGIGAIVLAGVTYGIKRNLSKNTRLLKNKLDIINTACLKDHGNGAKSGMLGQLECPHNQFLAGGGDA